MDEPFVCDECGRQATRADGTSWCIHCEREYQSGLNNPWGVNDGMVASHN